MCLNIKIFYLCAPMERFEYMKMPIGIFQQHVIQEYNLREKVHNVSVWIEIWRIIYGLPQAGKLANEFLKKKLVSDGYFEVNRTPGLWAHITRPI